MEVKAKTVKGLIALAVTAIGFTVFADEQPDLSGGQLWEDGPFWASCNIGATNPEEPGYHFWWGDTVGYVRNKTLNNWVSVDGNGTIIKFNPDDETASQTYNRDTTWLQSNGWIDASGNLVAEHDAARAHLKGDWRTPTSDELQTLVDKCNWESTTLNGVYGYIVTGKGDYASKGIFLPQTGVGFSNFYVHFGTDDGVCMSSTPSSDNPIAAVVLVYSQEGVFPLGDSNRNFGFPVRPVRGGKPKLKPAVSLVSAAQRYPWNNVVDYTYALSNCNASATYKLAVGLTVGGETKAVTNELTTVSDGNYTGTIDAATLFPNTFDKAGKIKLQLIEAK